MNSARYEVIMDTILTRIYHIRISLLTISFLLTLDQVLQYVLSPTVVTRSVQIVMRPPTISLQIITFSIALISGTLAKTKEEEMANQPRFIGSTFYQWLETVSSLILTKSGDFSLFFCYFWWCFYSHHENETEAVSSYGYHRSLSILIGYNKSDWSAGWESTLEGLVLYYSHKTEDILGNFKIRF